METVNTKAGTIQIGSAQELAKIGVADDYPLNGDYELTSDIDLSDYSDWDPIGGGVTGHGATSGDQVFNGTFNGNGFTISNISINKTVTETSSLGLFGIVASDDSSSYASVSNLLIRNINISVDMAAQIAVGGLAGEVNGYATINNVAVVNGNVAANTTRDGTTILGDLVGVAGVIGECRTADSVIGNGNIEITNVYNAARVVGSNFFSANYCSGIIGRIRGGNVKTLSDIVNVGRTAFTDSSANAVSRGYGIAAGDSSAESIVNVYYLDTTGTNLTLDGVAQYTPKTKDELTNGTIDMSSSWSVREGYYPIPTFANETSEAFDEDEFIAPGALGELSFDREFAKPGEVISVVNAPVGSTFYWTIENQITGEITIFSNTIGQYTPAEEDTESFLTVEVNGFEPLTMYISVLPVLYLDGDTQYYDVGKVDYVDYNMKIQGNEEFNLTNSTLYNGDVEIRLRGNSTAYRPKRPFKLKLGKKTNLFGFGNNKHWVLLANDIDHTLLRNKLLYDFSGDIGTEYYMKSTNVTMIFNGGYYGVYQLGEQIRVADVRVNIFDWDSLAEDAAAAIAKTVYPSGSDRDEFEEALYEDMAAGFDWIDDPYQFTFRGVTYQINAYVTIPDTNGGYMLEMDFYAYGDDTLAQVTTNYLQPIYFGAPEPTDIPLFEQNSLYNNADKNTQSFEYAIRGDEFIFRNSDPHFRATDTRFNTISNQWEATYVPVDYTDDVNDGKHYSEMYDMESLVLNYVFCEYAMNWDSMKNSFYMYKDIDKLARFGPQWDFDWAWGNINMYNIDTYFPNNWQTTIKKFAREQYYQSVQFNKLLVRDPYFFVKAYELYHQIRPTVIEEMIKEGGLMDQYRSYHTNPGAANDARWEYTFRDPSHYSGMNSVGYEESWDNMEQFLRSRVLWLDRQFDSIETLVDSINYYTSSTELEITDIDTESNEGFTTITAAIYNSDFVNVTFQVNGPNLYDAEVADGKATVSVPDSALEQTLGALNTVVVMAKDADGAYIYDIARSDTGNFNQVKSNYAVFTKEVEIDEPISTVDHIIINQLYGAGAKGDSAVSNSFVELYNPTSEAISLNGYKLIYNDTEELELNNVELPSYCSYLIRGALEKTSTAFYYTIETADQDWNLALDNKEIKLALYDGNNILVNAVDITDGISKQKSARRINFRDTGVVADDFEIIAYNAITEAEIARYRPRSLADGPWGLAESAGDIIINQFYGGGGKGDTAISNSFIELYNPTENAISLDGYRIVYDSTNELALNNVTLPSRTSYLIRGALEETSTTFKYTITVADQDWDMVIDNKEISLALYHNAELVDSVTITDGLSKQKTARRINFSNTGNPAVDFEIIPFNTISSAEIAEYRPRSMADGPWGLPAAGGDIIINQFYGGGGKGDTAISNSFIELYNPSDADISLEGYRIVYDGTNELELNNVILPSQTSYLIRGALEETSTTFSYTIAVADQDWDMIIDNKEISLALYHNTELVDSVTITDGLSKQKTARRINFSNTGNPAIDFEIIAFNDLSSADIQRYRPRSMADGPWDQDYDLTGLVTVEGTGSVGSVLTAVVTGTSEIGLNYQWKANFTDIPGETGKTYTITADDIGKQIMVIVTSSIKEGILISNRVTVEGRETLDVRDGLLAEYTLAGDSGRTDVSGNNLADAVPINSSQVTTLERYTRIDWNSLILPDNMFSSASDLSGFTVSFNVNSMYSDYWGMALLYFRNSAGTLDDIMFLTNYSNVGTPNHPYTTVDAWLDGNYAFYDKGWVRATLRYVESTNTMELYINDALVGRSTIAANASLTVEQIKAFNATYVGFPNDNSNNGIPALWDANIDISQFRVYERPLSYSEILTVYDNFNISVDKSELAIAIALANTADTSWYTEESVAAMNSALAVANEVQKNADATQDEVNEAWRNLMTAYRSLVLREADTESNLIAQFSFNNTLVDSVTGNSAELAGPNTGTPTAGAEAVFESGGVRFSGAGSYTLKLPTSLADSNSSYTISYDVIANELPSFTSMVFIPQEGTSPVLNLCNQWMDASRTPFLMTILDGSYVGFAAASDTLSGGGKHKVTIVVTDSTATMYIDNIVSSSGTILGGTGEGTIFVGGNVWDTPFNGIISNMVIYDRALSSVDVGALE